MSEPTAGGNGRDLSLPAEVRRGLEGEPAVGALEPAFALLTVDDAGRVDVCLLSRAEVDASPSTLRVVVAGAKAQRNLRATGRATFLAVADDAAHYLALRVRRVVEEQDATAAELEVERVLRDDLGVQLDPMRFRVEPRLAIEERWERSRRLLDRLAAGEGPS